MQQRDKTNNAASVERVNDITMSGGRGREKKRALVKLQARKIAAQAPLASFN